MNWDQFEGKWKQFKGILREKWGKLTNDDFDVIAGMRNRLAGKFQEEYGLAREAAERQAENWWKKERLQALRGVQARSRNPDLI